MHSTPLQTQGGSVQAVLQERMPVSGTMSRTGWRTAERNPTAGEPHVRNDGHISEGLPNILVIESG